jgi:hypothetical protein
MYGRVNWRSRLAAVFLISLFLLAAVVASSAQPHSWRITDFKDTISLGANGKVLVSEKITVAFIGTWHGIRRTIPIEYPGPDGTNYTLFLDVLSVADENGNKLKYDSSKSGNSRELKIYIPDAVDATRVVNIDYSVHNGVRFLGGYDEFYWNVTGNDWQAPMLRLKLRARCRCVADSLSTFIFRRRLSSLPRT